MVGSAPRPSIRFGCTRYALIILCWTWRELFKAAWLPKGSDLPSGELCRKVAGKEREAA